MPFDSTPRMTPRVKSMPVPGMCVPGGAKTPIMPARAFGAPQTTWTFEPSPGSTMQTRSRSALGCFSAERTRAIRKAAKSLVRSSTYSTSMPIMVSLSAIASSEASVSRCSLSQESVNFMMAVLLKEPNRKCAAIVGIQRFDKRDRLPSLVNEFFRRLHRERTADWRRIVGSISFALQPNDQSRRFCEGSRGPSAGRLPKAFLSGP